MEQGSPIQKSIPAIDDIIKKFLMNTSGPETDVEVKKVALEDLFLAYDIAEALGANVTELFPPMPIKVRLEEQAAKPWYVRLLLG